MILRNPLDPGCKLNGSKTFKRRPGCFLHILYAFYVHPMSRGQVLISFCYCSFFISSLSRFGFAFEWLKRKWQWLGAPFSIRHSTTVYIRGIFGTKYSTMDQVKLWKTAFKSFTRPILEYFAPFRIQSGVFDKDFLQKYVTARSRELFSQKSSILDGLRGLKY